MPEQDNFVGTDGISSWDADRLWIEGQDLLDGPSDPTVSESLGGVQGVPKITTSRNFIGGRSFKLGVSATF